MSWIHPLVSNKVNAYSYEPTDFGEGNDAPAYAMAFYYADDRYNSPSDSYMMVLL